jgi:hypothetical protein
MLNYGLKEDNQYILFIGGIINRSFLNRLTRFGLFISSAISVTNYKPISVYDATTTVTLSDIA